MTELKSIFDIHELDIICNTYYIPDTPYVIDINNIFGFRINILIKLDNKIIRNINLTNLVESIYCIPGVTHLTILLMTTIGRYLQSRWIDILLLFKDTKGHNFVYKDCTIVHFEDYELYECTFCNLKYTSLKEDYEYLAYDPKYDYSKLLENKLNCNEMIIKHIIE